jgi:formamidopyrimidine-DNA glycosylase
VPELPEVETVARGLANAVTGKTVDQIDVLLPRVVAAPPGEDFAESLKGDTFSAIGRRAKYITIDLASGRRLVIHLRMTGRLIVQQPGREEALPYARVIVTFTDGTLMVFADTRTFGRMRLLAATDEWDADGGIEPLSEAFTGDAFNAMLRGRQTPIKSFLLDQSRIAGIGNIYACEALWEAGIRPTRPSAKVSRPAGKRLHAAIVGVLERAVEARGTSVDDYVDAEGLKGGFQNQLSVYGRLGEPCTRCGSEIVRTVLGQRGTWWCRGCQK